jgi:hypothetical protein
LASRLKASPCDRPVPATAGLSHGMYKPVNFLEYFPKIKVGLSNHQPVSLSVCICVSPANNFWTDWWIFMTFGRQVMPLKVTSTPHFLIS